MADSVVCGHICLDIIPGIEGGAAFMAGLHPGNLLKVGSPAFSTGGAVANTGLALHRLGIKTSLCAKIGADSFGKIILECINAVSPELSGGMKPVPGETSSYTVVISPPGVDRIFLHCTGANDSFSSADLDLSACAGAKLLHFGYPPLMRGMYADGGKDLARLLGLARERGLATSLDLARPGPASHATKADWRGIFAQALPHVDLFLPSIDEMLMLTGDPAFAAFEKATLAGKPLGGLGLNDLRRVADYALGSGCAAVGLKLGCAGFYLRCTENHDRLAAGGLGRLIDVRRWAGAEVCLPCFQVKVAGTTGSGDSTIAGFLAGVLKGLLPREATLAALGAGACSVEQLDANSGIPCWKKLQARISGGWKMHAPVLDRME